MRARRISCLFFAVLGTFCLGFGPAILTDADTPRCGLTPHQMMIMEQIAPPEISAASYILVNPSTGQILQARNEDVRRSPASLVKIVTALVALERGRQEQEIEIQSSDVRVFSTVHLQNGEELSLRQLLFMLLISSDNAAAMAIARSLGGDVETYVGWMNDLVTSWGLTDTHFANPHGLDHEDSYSTARDLALIAWQAMRNPVFADIVGRAEAIAAYRNLESTNELLNTYPGAIGVKTGTTDLAGECLISMVDRPQGRALLVVLGSEDRFRDSRLMLDYFYANFAELDVTLRDTPQNRYLDGEGHWHAFGLQEPQVFLVSPWQVDEASLYRRLDNPSTTPDPQEPVGVLDVRLMGRPFSEIPLYVR
ncbi:MAG: D-alanyl-D-alanine carboxypeptidase family protein [Chloroflexota bacterium]|nr:D-alanyl-D-alanine carboxypeptidase family protein [Chloroflexota bacterium]